MLNPIFSKTNGDLSEIVNGAEDLEVYEQIDGEREEREVMADELPADKKQKLTLFSRAFALPYYIQIVMKLF